MKIHRVLLVLLCVCIFTTCSKNKFTTKPQLKIKSVNTDVVPLNGSITFRIEFTDKEGDPKDSLIVVKQRLNKRVVPTIRDVLSYIPPTFPDSKKGEFDLTLDYQTILSAISPPTIPGSNPPQKEADTLVVKFVSRDSKGNKSDTVSSGQIIVIRN